MLHSSQIDVNEHHTWSCIALNPPLPPEDADGAPIVQESEWRHHDSGDTYDLRSLRAKMVERVLLYAGQQHRPNVDTAFDEALTNVARYGLPEDMGRFDPQIFQVIMHLRREGEGLALGVQLIDQGPDLPKSIKEIIEDALTPEGLIRPHGRGFLMIQGYGFGIEVKRLDVQRKVVRLTRHFPFPSTEHAS